MERDCIISHGAASFLRERLLMVSDVYHIHICAHCGMIAVADLKNRRYFCQVCTKKTSLSLSSLFDEGYMPISSGVVQIIFPYSAKLLVQELMSMLIAPKIECSD